MDLVQEILVGARIAEIVRIHDYCQIVFDNAAILNAYNDGAVAAASVNAKQPEDLVGTIVNSVTESEHQLTIGLDTGDAVVIDVALRNLPKAAALHFRNKIIVWNE